MFSLAILGGGRAAWAYGSSWRRIGWPIDGVWLREESQSKLPELLSAPRKKLEELDADLVLIAVSDRAIAEVGARCAVLGARAAAHPDTGHRAPASPIVFHASGALPSIRGGFSLHPLRSLPPVGAPSDLRDALLVFEGQHVEIAKTIAGAIGARFAQIAAADKPRYHAAAVFGSNYVAAMLDIAERFIGIENVRDDLAALALSAIENWRAHTDARRFTGPAARGDAAVIEQHVAALAADAQVSEIYQLLAAEIARSILASQK
jgi:predicted short-subunit dehydrogenase-like oxidoreductase (DUF2520 family)